LPGSPCPLKTAGYQPQRRKRPESSMLLMHPEWEMAFVDPAVRTLTHFVTL
jgi:hypothetical protein